MLVVKIGKNQTEEKSKVVEAAVASFVETKHKIDELNVILKADKEVLIEKARKIFGDDDVSTITLMVGEDKVQMGFGFDIKISDDVLLRKVLGERFDDLVITKTSYAPEKKLKEMMLDDDGLAECLSIKEKATAFKVVK